MNKKRRISFGALLSIVFVMLVFSVSIGAVYSYFTATANKNISINFATLSLNIENENEFGTFFGYDEDYEEVIPSMPGEPLNFGEINVENTGNTDAYLLVKIAIEISKTGQETLVFEKWYNADAEEIDAEDIGNNEITATLLKRTGEENSSISLTDLTFNIPGDEVGDVYQGAVIVASATAYAVQAYMPNIPESYGGNAALYAASFIILNHSDFVV